MPVGKNSIKRVSNNGYSQVTTEAPDMENSTVVNVTEPAPTEKKPTKKAAAKKPTAKKPVAKKPVAKKPETPTPVSNIAPEIETDDGFVAFTLGEDLPYYLL